MCSGLAWNRYCNAKWRSCGSKILAGLAATSRNGSRAVSGHVVLNLRDQRRDKIEGLVNVGKLVQQFDHAVVVFEGMQAAPRAGGTRR